MKLNRLFPLIIASSFAISVAGCGGDDDSCDCATGDHCSDTEKAACAEAKCDCATGNNCSDEEKAKCSQSDPAKCDCATGNNCSEDEKAKCSQSDPAKCDCATGDNCSDEEKAACTKEVEEALKDLDANLAACKFTEASKALDEAWKLNQSDGSIAFQRSILGLMNLLHHEKIQALMSDLGFSSASVNFDASLWSADGLFKQMVAKGDDKDFGSVFDKVPHKAIGEDSPYFEDTISKTLKVSDLASAVLGMKDTILSLANSFEAAAKSTDGSKVLKIEKAGCSLNEIGFAATDLYIAAALLNLLVSSSQLVSAYDLDVTLYDLMNITDPDDEEDCNVGGVNDEAEANEAAEKCKKTCDNYIKDVNALISHILKVSDATKAKDGRAAFVEAARLIKEAGAKASKAPEGSFFGWSQLANGVINDVSNIATNITNSDGGSKAFKIDQITPALSVDLTKIFDTPLSTTIEQNAFCTVDISKYTDHNYETDTDTVYYYLYVGNGWDEDGIATFFAKDALKTITGRDVFVDYLDPEDKDRCENKGECDYIPEEEKEACYDSITQKEIEECIEDYTDHYAFKDDLSHNFSTAWEDISFDKFINPNEYYYSNEDYDY